MSNFKDLTGQKFGRLTVIKLSNPIYYYKHKCTIWECQCDCGKITLVRHSNLTVGNTKSCGCLDLDRKNTDNFIIGGCVLGTNIDSIKSKTIDSRNKTGIKGVFFDKKRNKYVPSITFKRNKYYLGRYDSFDDAANVRKEAENHIFGEFIEWWEDTYGKNSTESRANAT